MHLKTFFLASFALFSISASAHAQGFVGVSVAAIQSKARPDSVQLHEAGKYGVTYFVESTDENHQSVYNVTSFEKDGICTEYEYLAPLAEKPMLTQWLDRFYIKKSKDVWRSHNGILLTLTVEDDKVRLTESKPVAAKPVPKK